MTETDQQRYERACRVLKPVEIVVYAWPPPPSGMTTGMVAGVRVLHGLTGLTATATEDRHRYRNQRKAVDDLAVLVERWQNGEEVTDDRA